VVPQPPTPASKGDANDSRPDNAQVANPANKPMPIAAKVLAMAKGTPSTAAVRMNISGSMIGEAIQKAITGASGTPAASSAATIGTTPHEQKGDSAPNTAAHHAA
jgi:hypothetical protein